MQNVKNVLSSIIVLIGSAFSYVEAYTVYARAIAATLAILVSIMTLIRIYRNDK
jgi:hypothetical protein